MKAARRSRPLPSPIQERNRRLAATRFVHEAAGKAAEKGRYFQAVRTEVLAVLRPRRRATAAAGTQGATATPWPPSSAALIPALKSDVSATRQTAAPGRGRGFPGPIEVKRKNEGVDANSIETSLLVLASKACSLTTGSQK